MSRYPPSSTGSIFPRRPSSSPMIFARSSSLIRLQVAISGRVRKQPRHSPEAPSTVQTMTQGVAIARGGRAGEGAAGWFMIS